MNKPSLPAILAAHIIAVRHALSGVPGALEAYDARYRSELSRCQPREDGQRPEIPNPD